MKPSCYPKTASSAPTEVHPAAHSAWHTAYPRPALRRAEETCRHLTDWTLSCVDTVTAHTAPLGRITLPYPPESPLSGIGMTLEANEAWLYETTFSSDRTASDDPRLLLHLPPTDQMCTVTLNGHSFGETVTANLPTALDITPYTVPGENRLSVFVRDPLDPAIPYGKQAKKRGGMWYTPTAGMRGMPWLETVPNAYIRALRITPTLDSVEISVSGCEELPKTLVYETEAGDETVRFDGNRVTLHISEPHLWTPDDPYVYRFTLACGNDTVSSYFALRTVTAETVGGRAVLCLNGKPHYFHGLLDQGYHADGIDLPACPDGYRRDIEAAKALGFDTLRKHIRVDDPYFYYFCDMHGMCVFQDFVNNGKYSFLRDTALPTVGFRRGIRRHASARERTLFTDTADRTQQLLYNHPSVVYYTIFNEGWGQFDPDAQYARYRSADPTRIYDATSGWFYGRESDVQSEHVYFRRLNLKSDGCRPLVLSEFGGYACKLDGHVFNTEKSYGYKTLSSPAALTDALDKLYRDEVLPMIDRGLCVTIYTQITDVEDEINGLYTYDRQVCKVDAETMRNIAEDLRGAFDRMWTSVQRYTINTASDPAQKE